MRRPKPRRLMHRWRGCYFLEHYGHDHGVRAHLRVGPVMPAVVLPARVRSAVRRGPSGPYVASRRWIVLVATPARVRGAPVSTGALALSGGRVLVAVGRFRIHRIDELLRTNPYRSGNVNSAIAGRLIHKPRGRSTVFSVGAGLIRVNREVVVR